MQFELVLTVDIALSWFLLVQMDPYFIAVGVTWALIFFSQINNYGILSANNVS